MADQKSCQTKPIASTADYLSRKAMVGSMLPITARDLGSKYGFTFDPLTDERRTTYNDVYLGECLTALMQYLYGQPITPGSGGDTPPVNPPAPVTPPLTGVRIFAPKSIYAGDTAILVARPIGGSSQVAFDWEAGGIDPQSLNKDRSIQSAVFKTPGPVTITATANDNGVTQTGTVTISVQALPGTPVPADDIEIDGINLYASAPVITGQSVLLAATARQGTNIQWAWDFGDGSPTTSGQIVSHTFQSVGSYMVKLVATNPKGSKAYVGGNGQEGYSLTVITDPNAITYDTNIDSDNIRVPMPDPIYTNVSYDFGAFLMDKVVENPQWAWSFKPVKDDGTPAQSGDQISSRYWGHGQIEDNRWSDDDAGTRTIWIRLVYGPKEARRTVYSNEIVTIKTLPKAGTTPVTPTPTGPTYDTVINPQDITMPIPDTPYVGVQYELAAFLETKRAENPSWWFTFDPMDSNNQPIESGTLIDPNAWKPGPVVDMSFPTGQDGPHWVWAKLEYGATNARQVVFAKSAISVKKLPGTATVYPLSADSMALVIVPQSDPFGAKQLDDPSVVPTVHASEYVTFYVFTRGRAFPPGTTFSYVIFKGGSAYDSPLNTALLPYPTVSEKPSPSSTDMVTVLVKQPGASDITLTRPINFVAESLSKDPLKASDLFFIAYSPELTSTKALENALNGTPAPATIGTRLPLAVSTRLGKTFPPNTRFQFYTDVQYGAWKPTAPTLGVPLYLCDLTGVDGDTTKPVTSPPGPVNAYVTVMQPGTASFTLTAKLDLKAASAPPAADPTIPANRIALGVYPPNLSVGEAVNYITKKLPMPIKAGAAFPVMVATGGAFPRGTMFQFATTLTIGGKVPQLNQNYSPIYMLDLAKEDGSQAGTQQISVTIKQPGAADITLSQDVFYQTGLPLDTDPVKPWEIDLKAQGLRGDIIKTDRLEPGMHYYLLPEITGRNVRGRFKMVMMLDGDLFPNKNDMNASDCFLWLDGDPKDDSRSRFFNWGVNVSEEKSPEDFNPRNPTVDDAQAATLIEDGRQRGPNERFMYIVAFQPTDENGKDVGDPVARGFYPQVIDTSHILAGFPGEPDQSAAITVSGIPQPGCVINTEYTLVAGLMRGYVVDGGIDFQWIIGQPYDTDPTTFDARSWQAVKSDGRFVIKIDESMVADPGDPQFKNIKFKLWVKLIAHHLDGKDSATISEVFTVVANPG